jgi:glycerophosphoryl diester phosphodiesterase
MRAILVAAAVAALIAAGPAAALDVFAHRGGPLVDGWAAFPENTLPAFRSAARAGTGLELDVRLSLDRVPLVIHDATFDRTTTCRGFVAVRDSGSVRKRCRAPWPATGRTTTVPTLGQVLAVAARHAVPAMVEIKGDGDARAVVDAIRRSPLPRRLVIVQSFSPRALDVAARRWPGVPTALLSTHAERHSARRRASGRYTWVAPRWPVTGAYVARAHAEGLRVLPFSVNSPAAVARAVAVGADAFITDDPTAARRTLHRG